LYYNQVASSGIDIAIFYTSSRISCKTHSMIIVKNILV